MRKKKIKITVLIPAHNEEKMIAACVNSCLNQTRRADQIIVINDGSTDATEQILERFGEKIEVITATTATGNKSRAQELSIPHVKGDLIVATDGDTMLDRDFIRLVEKDFLDDPELKVVAGYVQSTKNNILTALREIDYTVGQDILKLAQSHLYFLLVIPGCAGVFRAELFKNKIITFDHDTITEDLDFTYKINGFGMKIKFNPHAKVYTQDPPTIHSYINQIRRWYGGGWQNLRKHFKIVVSRPSAALVLTSIYVEGMVLGLTVFVSPFVNFKLFIIIFSLYFLNGFGAGLYSSIRKRRFDLLLVVPFIPFMIMINSYVLMEQFVKEIILRRTNMKWFHPKRLGLTPKS
jgi:peptidoglycan-N-acetylglucosamine deacetylase